mmetsp:Transcript_20965/g.67928  ORF Transcript_20965/g.67928 Transcript_20965/m.67928 type:complete len:273 (+) Transcript_20965:562-1380(+)|eukprot:scaffold9530_cov104-Isochrysis_galbana.AAC.5
MGPQALQRLEGGRVWRHHVRLDELDHTARAYAGGTARGRRSRWLAGRDAGGRPFELDRSCRRRGRGAPHPSQQLGLHAQRTLLEEGGRIGGLHRLGAPGADARQATAEPKPQDHRRIAAARRSLGMAAERGARVVVQPSAQRPSRGVAARQGEDGSRGGGEAEDLAEEEADDHFAGVWRCFDGAPGGAPDADFELDHAADGRGERRRGQPLRVRRRSDHALQVLLRHGKVERKRQLRVTPADGHSWPAAGRSSRCDRLEGVLDPHAEPVALA